MDRALAFLEWKKENPDAFDALVDVCQRAVLKGYEKWSVQAAFEVIRWESKVNTTDMEYKLNNNFRAMAARYLMFMGLVPAGFFETREITRKVLSGTSHEEDI